MPSLTPDFQNRLTALKHVPPSFCRVGIDPQRFSILIHGRIAEVVAKETVVKQSKKSRELLHFLVIVIIVHQFAHIARSYFHGVDLYAANSKDYHTLLNRVTI